MATVPLEWRGTKRYSISEDGVVLDTIKGKKKLPFIRNGYKCVRLNDGLKDKNEYVHRLLGKAFIPNPLGLPCINHIDGDKLNNSLDNLEWCTYTDNLNHAYLHGLNHRARKIRCVETGRVYNSIMQCQREIGINRSSLWKCLSGRNKTCAKMHWEYIK